MNTQRDTFGAQMGRPIPVQSRGLSAFISQTLASVAEREQQRSRLVNILIIAQALLTLAVAPAYINAPSAPVPLVILLCALVIFLLALSLNRFFHRVSTAAYTLVVGGGVTIIALMLVLALGGHPTDAGQAALLFPAIILEAGLLFAPEVTIIVAFIATAATAVALLLGISLMQRADPSQVYLLIAYTLGVQLLSGLAAWLFAQFIFESALKTQQTEELQFAQARLEALNSKIAQQQHALDGSIRSLQITLTSAMGGEYTARAEVAAPELAPLAESLNLLLERVETTTQTEQVQARIQAAVIPLIDSISRLADTGTPTPSSLPIMTNTPFDTLAVVINQMQVSVSQRLARVQRLASDVAGALGHSQDGLNSASEAAQEARSIGGRLIASTEALLAGIQRQISQFAEMRRMLSALLPQEITQMAPQGETRLEQGGVGQGASLLGLGNDLGLTNAGLTAEFPVMSGDDEPSADIPPMTMPLPIVELSPLVSASPDQLKASSGQGERAAAATPTAPLTKAGELAPELVECWHLLLQLNGEAAQLEQSVSQLTRELGLQSRHLRTADLNIAWFRSAIEAVQGNADQLQQVAGAVIPPPGPGEPLPATPSRPLGPFGVQGEPPMGSPSRPLGGARVSPPTRPLAADLRREDLASLAELAQNQQAFPPVAPPAVSDEPPAPGSLRASDLFSLDEDDPGL